MFHVNKRFRRGLLVLMTAGIYAALVAAGTRCPHFAASLGYRQVEQRTYRKNQICKTNVPGFVHSQRVQDVTTCAMIAQCMLYARCSTHPIMHCDQGVL